MMKKSCGKTVMKTFLHFSSLCFVFSMWCLWICVCVFVSQVGDHHPDLYVWNLHNHHEVSLVLSPQCCLCQSAAPSRVTTPLKPVSLACVPYRFNRSLCSLVERHCSRAGQPCLSSLRRTTAVGSIGDCDNDMVPLKPGTWACLSVCIEYMKDFSQFLSSVQET